MVSPGHAAERRHHPFTEPSRGFELAAQHTEAGEDDEQARARNSGQSENESDEDEDDAGEDPARANRVLEHRAYADTSRLHEAGSTPAQALWHPRAPCI
jgi:hypothetical protein